MEYSDNQDGSMVFFRMVYFIKIIQTPFTLLKFIMMIQTLITERKMFWYKVKLDGHF